MLQEQLHAKIDALREAEQTLVSYGEMETEWRNHNENLEEKVKDMEEVLMNRDQDIAKYVVDVDKLEKQVQEKGDHHCKHNIQVMLQCINRESDKFTCVHLNLTILPVYVYAQTKS